MGYQIKRSRRDDGAGEYHTKSFRYVLAAHGTTYEPCPPYAHDMDRGSECMIRTITEMARAMMIDSQAPVHFWGEAVNTAVYLHQRSPDEGLKRKNDHDGYQAPCETPYKMLHGVGKPTHNADGNEISYQASLFNLRRLECYASRLIPEVERHQGMFGPRSNPCMMVGYTHNSKTLWRICDPEFQRVKSQSEVILDEERNSHMLCQHGSNGLDMFGLQEDEEDVEETDTGDGPLPDSQPMEIGKRTKSHMHKAPDEEAENDHSRRIRHDDQTAQRSAANAGNIIQSRRLRREDQTAWRSAAAIIKSSQVLPAAPAPTIGSRVTRSPGTTPAEALTASAADLFTYGEAMENPQRDHWKRAMEEESTSILLNNTFSTLNSREARNCIFSLLALSWFTRLNTILTGPDGTKHS